MKRFKKQSRFGISLKVLTGLVIIVLVTVGSIGVAHYYFHKFEAMFRTIPDEHLPLLMTASKLVKGTEKMVRNAADIALTDNPLVLATLKQTIEQNFRENQELIAQLEASNLKGFDTLPDRFQRLFENLQTLIDLVNRDNEINGRLLQIAMHIRQVSDAFMTETEALRHDAALSRLRETYMQIFSLLRDVPNIPDAQRLAEYQAQLTRLQNMTEEGWQGGHRNTELFSRYSATLERYGTGENGLLALMEIRLQQKEAIRNNLIENTFFSDVLIKQIDQIFLTVSGNVQRQSLETASEIDVLHTLFLMIPVVLVLSAFLIFLFIRRSVTGRILTLEHCMRSHVEGVPVPVSAEGNDEITSMAQSLSYFIEQRYEYEASLQEAKAAAEQAEEMMRKERNKAQQYFNIAGVILVVIDADQSVQRINQKGCEILGYVEAEIIGKNWFETFLPEDERERVKTGFNQLIAGEIEPVEYFESPVLTRNDEERLIAWHNTVLCDEQGKIIGALSSGEDITDHKQMEQTLRQSEALLNATQHLSRVGGWEWDVEKQTMFWTEEVYRIHDFVPSEVTPGSAEHIARSVECYAPEDRPVILAAFQRCAEEGQPYDLEFPFTTAKGRQLWIRTTAEPVRDHDRIIRVVGNIMDITERKQAEERLKATLREKEVLLKEIHHRVKNNLQLVSSLLYLQSQTVRDPQTLEVLRESMNRVKSMSLVHEQLYRSENLADIDVAQFIRSFSAHLFHTYKTLASAVSLDITVEDVFLTIDMAVPCALILNELISNAFKHAFPEGRHGEIRIAMSKQPDHLMLRVSDTGVGIPEDIDIQRVDSLGLDLVTELVTRQLHGTIELDRTGGTTFMMTFPSNR